MNNNMKKLDEVYYNNKIVGNIYAYDKIYTYKTRKLITKYINDAESNGINELYYIKKIKRYALTYLLTDLQSRTTNYSGNIINYNYILIVFNDDLYNVFEFILDECPNVYPKFFGNGFFADSKSWYNRENIDDLFVNIIRCKRNLEDAANELDIFNETGWDKHGMHQNKNKIIQNFEEAQLEYNSIYPKKITNTFLEENRIK